MNNSTREVCGELLYALGAPHQLREDIFSSPSHRLLHAVCEFALNLLYGEIPLSEEDKLTLKRHKEHLEILADEDKKYTKKVSVLRKIEPELLNILREILQRHV
jgi:hypothetical protein